MKPNQTVRIRALLKARKTSESIIQDAALKSFRLCWRDLVPAVRTLRKQGDPIDEVLNEFERQFGDALNTALTNGATMLAATEQDWYNAAGYDVVYDPIAVVNEYRSFIGYQIGRGKDPELDISERTRDAVRDEIMRWYANPDATLQDLEDALSQWFDEDRALSIAITETTNLVSMVTGYGMRQAGLYRWSWQTRQEWNTCSRCSALHGKIFTLDDPMPPLHPNCYCVPAQELD